MRFGLVGALALVGCTTVIVQPSGAPLAPDASTADGSVGMPGADASSVEAAVPLEAGPAGDAAGDFDVEPADSGPDVIESVDGGDAGDANATDAGDGAADASVFDAGPDADQDAGGSDSGDDASDAAPDVYDPCISSACPTAPCMLNTSPCCKADHSGCGCGFQTYCL